MFIQKIPQKNVKDGDIYRGKRWNEEEQANKTEKDGKRGEGKMREKRQEKKRGNG